MIFSDQGDEVPVDQIRPDRGRWQGVLGSDSPRLRFLKSGTEAVEERGHQRTDCTLPVRRVGLQQAVEEREILVAQGKGLPGKVEAGVCKDIEPVVEQFLQVETQA